MRFLSSPGTLRNICMSASLSGFRAGFVSSSIGSSAMSWCVLDSSLYWWFRLWRLRRLQDAANCIKVHSRMQQTVQSYTAGCSKLYKGRKQYSANCIKVAQQDAANCIKVAQQDAANCIQVCSKQSGCSKLYTGIQQDAANCIQVYSRMQQTV